MDDYKVKLIIAGGRDFEDYEEVERAFFFFFDWALPPAYIEIVSGGARGADALGERLAKSINMGVRRFPADWDKHGKGAGHVRNAEMADYADALLAFWDGKSRGTANMIKQMQFRNKPYVVSPYGAT